MASTTTPLLSSAAGCILQWLSAYRSRHAACPLVVAISGVQGSGKTTLTTALCRHLSNLEKPVSALSISLDDFYLPHDDQVALAASTRCDLWASRGNPGTHDVPLLLSTMRALKSLGSNGSADDVLEVPRYDKATYGGAGDRATHDAWLRVSSAAPPDVVLVEGWMLGFLPRSPPDIATLHSSATARQPPASAYGAAHTAELLATRYPLHTLQELNARLAEYTPLYSHVDAFIHICHNLPAAANDDTRLDWSIVYRWRLEQEHTLRQQLARKGQAGHTATSGAMSDEQVARFVDRFVPMYVMCAQRLAEHNLFAQLPNADSAALPRRPHVRIDVDDDRQFIALHELPRV
ncbi:hypothetical protein RI367_001649 [Sorochytrium milnesiophthora]